MVVLLGCGLAPEPLAVLRQILLLQKLVGGRIRGDIVQFRLPPKELEPIPQFKATAKLSDFLEQRYSRKF
jgi:hypothetical protein